MSWQTQGIALLAASLARPLALVAGAWLFIRAVRVRHPSSQHAVWTAVLLGMLLLPTLSLLTPHWSLPLLPRHAMGGATVDLANAGSVPSALRAPIGAQAPYATAAPPAKLAGGFNFATAGAMILACYLFGLLAMATGWMAGWISLRRLIANSKSLRGRRLRESSAVASPVTAGVLRPIVILPAGWRAWPANTRRAVLMHEFAHIRRRDTLALTLGRLVECVFWFHPLAWWLSRKTLELAEFACDATVLERTGDPAEYSRMLIEFAAAARRAGHRTALPGLAMARSGSGLGRRIDHLFKLSRRPTRKLPRPGFWLAALGVPVLCLAATAGLRAHGAPPFIPARLPTALPAWAQSPQPQLRFDVVSVKPSPPGAPMLPDKPQRGGYWVVRGVPTAWLIYVTFETQPNLVVGVPAWAKQSRYDVEARMPPSTTDSQLHLMLQSMFADRFRMVWHTQMRPTDVSILSAGAPGPGLHPARGHCLPPGKAAPPKSDEYECGVVHAADSGTNGVEIAGSSVTLDALARFLTRLRRTPVIAESGPKALYDFDVTLPGPTPVQGESGEEQDFDLKKEIQSAFRKQLGLDLDMTKTVKRPLTVLVIDHLDPASAN